ncbi:MAG: LpxI family protein [Candidatus Binatia bacterium]
MRVGLIAGNGQFPLIFARTARAEGVEVIAVAHEHETLPALGDVVDAITWIQVGELERIIRTFRDWGVNRAVMAGGIRKAALFEHFKPDERAQRFLARVRNFGDDTLLRGLAAELEDEGVQIVASTLFLSTILTPAGPLTRRQPTDAQWQDIRQGMAVAQAIGSWDIGQSVVVQAGVVLAVEAIEGTDATIRRGGRPDAVVVKVSKPQQDLRFDVPAIGPETVRVCASAGVAVLALEAGRTLLLDKEQVLRRAEATGLSIVGVQAGSPHVGPRR